MSKRQVIEVKGFDESHGRSQRSQPPTNVSNRVTEVASNPLVPLLLEGEESGSVPVTELLTVLPVVNSEDVHPNVASGVIIGPSSNVNQPADFEAIIGEIDEALEDNAPISNSLGAEVIHEIQEKSSNVLGGFKGSDKQVMGIASDRSPNNEEVAGFSVGWAEMADKKKIVKAGKGKATKKGKSEVGQTRGMDSGKDQKKGSWTRLQSRPSGELMTVDRLDDMGSKRKATVGMESIKEAAVCERK
nr:hypothetical protein CFP56_42738 [Quercus suber]